MRLIKLNSVADPNGAQIWFLNTADEKRRAFYPMETVKNTLRNITLDRED